MTQRSVPARSPHAQRGFTLIELFVVLVIVGILAAVAYPSFQDSVRSSRRSDAVDALTRLQQAQERWRANNATYAANAALTTAWPGGLGQSATSQGGYYTVSIQANSATGYTLRAQAVTTKSQEKDKAGSTECKRLEITATAGNFTYTPAVCWKR